MRSVYETRVAEAREIERELLQGTAKICSNRFGIAWKALFPIKAAEELAARTDVSVRTAASQLSGEFPLSGRSLAAIIAEIARQ